MTAPIRPIVSIEPAGGSRPMGESRGAAGSFDEVFSAAIRRVEGAGHEAAASVDRFLSGEGEELHTAALAVQKASLTFELFLETRNKVVSAYQEIMRMQM
jgi:flagellar hook-basal body complex protein FliE